MDIKKVRYWLEGAVPLSQNLQTQTSHTNNINFVILRHFTVWNVGSLGRELQLNETAQKIKSKKNIFFY